MTSPLIPLLYERKRIVFRDALYLVANSKNQYLIAKSNLPRMNATNDKKKS